MRVNTAEGNVTFCRQNRRKIWRPHTKQTTRKINGLLQKRKKQAVVMHRNGARDEAARHAMEHASSTQPHRHEKVASRLVGRRQGPAKDQLSETSEWRKKSTQQTTASVTDK